MQLHFMQEKDEPYKVELGINEHAEKGEPISFYISRASLQSFAQVLIL